MSGEKVLAARERPAATREGRGASHEPRGVPTLGRLLQAAGNRAAGRLLASAPIQPKLAISQPGDVFEDEADRVADKVMRMPDPRLQRSCACGGTCSDCQDEEPTVLARSALPDGNVGTAPPIVQEVLRAPGYRLDSATRAFMEPRLGQDLGQVRVYTDPHAAESARQVHARAYTVGNHIVFGEGQWRPREEQGGRLLAHELTHVMQQAAGTLRRKPLKAPYRAEIVIPKDLAGKSAKVQTCKNVNAEDCRFDVLTPGMEVTVTEEFVGGAWLFVDHLPEKAVAALYGQKGIFVPAKFVRRLVTAPAATAKPVATTAPALVEQTSDAIYGRDESRVLELLNAGGLDDSFELLKKVEAAARAKSQISPVLILTDDYHLTTGDARALRVAVAAHTVSLGLGYTSGSVEEAYDELITAARRLGGFEPGLISVYLDRHGDEAVKSIVEQRRSEQMQGVLEQMEQSRRAEKDPLGVFQKRLQEKVLQRLDENEAAVRKQQSALAEGGSSDAWKRLQNVVVPEAVHYAQLTDLEEKLTTLVQYTTKAVTAAKEGRDDAAAIAYSEGRGEPPAGAWWRPNRFPLGGGGAESPPDVAELEAELVEDQDQLASVRDQRANIRARIPLVKALRPGLLAKLKRGPGRNDPSAVQAFRNEMIAELQRQVFDVAFSGIKMLRADVEAGRARLYSFAPLVQEVKAELLLSSDAEARIDTWVKDQTGRDETIRVVTSALTLALLPLWFVPGAQLIPAIVGAIAATYNAELVGGQYVAAKAGMMGKDITGQSLEDLRWESNWAVLELVLAGVDIGVAVHTVVAARAAVRAAAAAEELARARRAAQEAAEAAEAAERAKQAATPAGRKTKSGLVVHEGGGESTSGPRGKLRAIEGGGEPSKPPPRPAPTPEPVEMPKLKTGTDATVDVVGGEVELRKPGGIDPTQPRASAGTSGGGGSTKSPKLRAIEGGASERPVKEVHVPPDRPPVRVDPRARGYALEDLHMESTLAREGYEALPNWFKTHDAYKGGTVRNVTEGGRKIRVVKGADVVSVKSTQITESAALTEKVTADLNKLRGRFEYTREGLRLEGVKSRRLDLIFEEGADITKETVSTLKQLQKQAGSIDMKWYVVKYGEKIPGPQYLKDYAKFIESL